MSRRCTVLDRLPSAGGLRHVAFAPGEFRPCRRSFCRDQSAFNCGQGSQAMRPDTAALPDARNGITTSNREIALARADCRSAWRSFGHSEWIRCAAGMW
jgi:hypothetical protein